LRRPPANNTLKSGKQRHDSNLVLCVVKRAAQVAEIRSIEPRQRLLTGWNSTAGVEVVANAGDNRQHTQADENV
jgi:hypothetical protein